MEEKPNKGFLYWFTNVFWYHYGKIALIVVVLVIIAVWLTVDALHKETYDLNIVVAANGPVADTDAEALHTALMKKIEDVNGDGKVLINIQTIDLSDPENLDGNQQRLLLYLALPEYTLFLLDEDQAVTTKDIGSVQEISKWCKELNSTIIMREETKLTSQFRCNGSDAYIQFVDNLLQRGKESVRIPLSELNYDFRIFDDPSQMREALREINAINNKARMVAGYCYDWNVKNHRGDVDISLPGGFQAKWNLANDKIWAINPRSFEEVGCIHTAQGLEFDYVGVLIGKDLTYDRASEVVRTDKTAISKDDKTSGIRGASDEEARRLILNTYKTLLTRGQKGCFVYCEDDALQEYFKKQTSI